MQFMVIPFSRVAVGMVCLATLLASCGGSSGDAAPRSSVQKAVAHLDTLVPELMARTGVPGVAVSVVYRGQTLYAKGFGVRKVGEEAPVDADTVFQLASVSKSLGATVMAGRMPGGPTPGKINWNTPIQHVLPEFELAYADPALNAQLTLGKLYAHRSGLGDHAGDQLEDLGYTRSDILQRLRWAGLGSPGDYAYTNFGLTAAAEGAARAEGVDWATLSEQTLY